jgi:acetoin utilization deacetylase AcuC-like enzyme
MSAVFLAYRVLGALDSRGHPERPARITAIESSLAELGWLAYEVRQAPPASRELLVAVHSAEYVDAVRSMR